MTPYRRPLLAAAAAGLCVLIAGLAAPAGADRAYFCAMAAPLLLAFAVPFGFRREASWKRDLACAGATGLAAAAAFAGFFVGAPGIASALGAGLLLACWSILIAGLFRAGARVSVATGQFTGTILPLALCATHLLADPLVDAVQTKPSLRQAAISFAINANPSLISSSGFWDRDPLHSAYGYARSEIGSFHGYSYASWWLVALLYAAIGIALYASFGGFRVRNVDGVKGPEGLGARGPEGTAAQGTESLEARGPEGQSVGGPV
jgi:hypothetical protein